MTHTCQWPPRGESADGPEAISLEGNASNIAQNPGPAQENLLRNPRAVREAKLELLREAIHEACGFIQLHANVCQDLAEAGDNAGLIHSLGRLVTYTKDAARNGNDLRALREEGGQ